MMSLCCDVLKALQGKTLVTAESLTGGGIGADAAVAVTGLAGPGGDEFGHSVGTVFIGYQDAAHSDAREYHFSGDREAVRNQTIEAALRLVLEHQK